MYVCIYLSMFVCMYVCTRQSSWNTDSSTVQRDWPQHDHPASCIIAQQFPSATFVLLRFHNGKKNSSRLLYQFSSLHCVSRKLRNLKLRKPGSGIISLPWIPVESMFIRYRCIDLSVIGHQQLKTVTKGSLFQTCGIFFFLLYCQPRNDNLKFYYYYNIWDARG